MVHVFSTIEVWDKHTGPSELEGLDVTEYIARIRCGPLEQEDGAQSTWQRPKQDSCLTNSPLHSFIVHLTC